MTARRVAASTGLAFVVLALLVVAEWAPVMDLDHGLVGPTTDIARDHDDYRDAMKAATWLLNSQLVLAYGALAAVALAIARRCGAAVWLAVVVGLGSAANPLLKLIFGRERPTVIDPVEVFDGLSFPSGHANSAALISAALFVVLWPGLGHRGQIVAAVAVTAVPLLSGWTRMTLGGHYLSDVLGGTLLGVAWVAAWQPALPALERVLSARTSPRR